MEEQQILQKINLDFARAGIPPRVFAKQGDNNMRVVAVSLYNDGKAYKVPGGYAVNVSAKKPDGKSVYNPATEVAGNVAYITLTQQMLAVRGIVSAEIEVVRGADTLKTEKWQINVEECANPENQIESTDEYKTIQQLLAETEAAKTAASASNAAKSAQEAKDAAAQAAADAKKVIDEGVNDKLQQMQKIQTDVTAKADKVSTDAAKVEGYAKAAKYLIGYNEKNILTVFLYEE
jgi:hypothetical protein